jgi:hypothetical protein
MREPAVAHSGLLSLVHLSSENSYRPGRSSQRRRRSRVLLAPSSTLSLRLRAVRRDAQPAVSGLAALSLPAAPKETGQRHRWPGEDGLSVVPVLAARTLILVVEERTDATQLVGVVADVVGV